MASKQEKKYADKNMGDERGTKADRTQNVARSHKTNRGVFAGNGD